jgi:hypothetical protein
MSNIVAKHTLHWFYETCITSLGSFEHMVTLLRSGQEMLYKNQRSFIQTGTR